MITDQGLPGEMCLLAYDLHRNRFVGMPTLEYLVRGAALTELLADGAIAVHGRVVASSPDRPDLDPVLERLVEEIEHQGAPSWRKLLRPVEERCAVDGVRVGAYGRAAANRLQGWTRNLLTGERLDDGDLAMLDVALVPLAGAVRLTTVASRRDWRANRDRVSTVTGRLADAIPGFGDLIAEMRGLRGRAFASGAAAR